MNIIFSAASGSDKGEGTHYRNVLSRLGHTLFWASAPNRDYNPAHGNIPEAGFAPDTSFESLLQLIGQDIALFLYVEPLGLIPKGIEKVPFPTACVISDMHRDLKNRQRLARFFDHVFLYHRNYVSAIDEHPKDYIHWLPCACDLEFFHPLEKVRDIDIAFIGILGISSERSRVISKIARYWNVNEPRYYLQREIPEIYSRAKIVLNLPLADDLNFRTFEAMSCGAMLLTRRLANGQEELFEEGKHFAAFSNEQELFDKLDYYLTHPAERETIAAAGLAEVQQHHRLEQRLEKLLTIVRDNPDKVAPIRHMSPCQVDRQYAWLYEYWHMLDPALALIGQARQCGHPWLPLLLPMFRTLARRLKSKR